MHILKTSVKPSDDPQVRLCLVGPSGFGKSTSAATFPGPVFANFDRTLKSISDRDDIQMLPFFNPEFCKTAYGNILPHNAFRRFLETDAMALDRDQTLVIDSLTSLQDFFHLTVEKDTEALKSKFYIWDQKLKYLRDIHMLFKKLRCHVITILHEVPIKDEGELTDKFKPSISGSYAYLIAKEYTDSFRQCILKIMDPVTKKLVDEYAWQVKPSDKFEFVKARVKTDKTHIKATYESLVELYQKH